MVSMIELHKAAKGGFWDDQALAFFRVANECVLTLIDRVWDDIEKLQKPPE